MNQESQLFLSKSLSTNNQSSKYTFSTPLNYLNKNKEWREKHAEQIETDDDADDNLFLNTISLDIEYADYYELLLWCKTLDLNETGTKEDLKNRLYAYYDISALKDEIDEKKNIIKILAANSTEYLTIDEIEEEVNSGRIKGIKLHQCLSEFSNDSPEMDKIAEIAGKNKLPIFIHVISPAEVRKLLDLARKYPETNFILAHFIGLEIAKRKGKDLKNLYFDTSTYYIISHQPG